MRLHCQYQRALRLIPFASFYSFFLSEYNKGEKEHRKTTEEAYSSLNKSRRLSWFIELFCFWFVLTLFEFLLNLFNLRCPASICIHSPDWSLESKSIRTCQNWCGKRLCCKNNATRKQRGPRTAALRCGLHFIESGDGKSEYCGKAPHYRTTYRLWTAGSWFLHLNCCLFFSMYVCTFFNRLIRTKW